MKKKFTTFRIDADLDNQIRKHAETTGYSRTQIVEKALRQYLYFKEIRKMSTFNPKNIHDVMTFTGTTIDNWHGMTQDDIEGVLRSYISETLDRDNPNDQHDYDSDVPAMAQTIFENL